MQIIFALYLPFTSSPPPILLHQTPSSSLRCFLSCFFTHLSFTLRQPVSLRLHLYFPLFSSQHTHPSSSLSYSLLLPCLAPERWHSRGSRCVMRASLTPPTPLQSMCITAKCNGEPCESHQYVTRGDVVILQMTVSKLICFQHIPFTYFFFAR